MYVVEYHGHSVAGRFRQADIPRDDCFKDLGAEESTQVCCDLP
jgi:hypothetical protein